MHSVIYLLMIWLMSQAADTLLPTPQAPQTATTSTSPDTACFDNEYGNVKINNTRVQSVMIEITQSKNSQLNFGDVTTKIVSQEKKILQRGVRTEVHYWSGTGKSTFSYRNLTLLFDGDVVYAGIGILAESYNSLVGGYSRSWACQTYSSGGGGVSTLKYYKDMNIYLSGKTQSSSIDLDIKVFPFDTPYGPSYDNNCAAFLGAYQDENTTLSGSITVNVKQIYRVTARFKSYDSVRAELTVKVTPGTPTVLQYNHTVAQGHKYGFMGAGVSPRNLTMWVNSTRHLAAAISLLDQSYRFIYDHAESKETWECPQWEESEKGGREIAFCEFSTYNKGTYSSREDILLINVINKNISSGDRVIPGTLVAFLLLLIML